MLGRLSLELAAQWWVREVQPALGPAPPVYDPGGPVLHVDDLDDDADLTAVERESAMMGAVLLIVPAVPGSARAERLSRPGWSVASDWYLAGPRRPDPGPGRACCGVDKRPGASRGSKGGLRSSHWIVCTTSTCW